MANSTNQYIYRKLIPNYLMGAGIITFILFLIEGYKSIILIEKGMPIEKVVNILFYFIPPTLQLAIPLAVVIGVSNAIATSYNNDNKFIIKSSVGFGVLIVILSIVSYEFILPKTASQYAQAKIELYKMILRLNYPKT